MPIGDLLPEIALIAGALVVLLAALVSPRERQGAVGAPLALVTLAVAGVAKARLHLESPGRLTFSGTWALDGLGAWGAYVILGTSAFVVALSPRWFHTDRRHGEWYVMLLLSTLGAVVLTGAADLVELILGLLLVSATGTTLASFHRASRMSAEAGAKLYFLGALASPLLFLGSVLLYGLAGDTGYAALSEALTSPHADQLARSAGVALVVVALSFELGAFPAHPWVPDVAQGSPAPAAAFLTVAPKVGALVALLRFVALLPEDAAWRPALATVAALTMTLGNLAALAQEDVRRLLGWSSVSQIGYGLLAVVAVERSALALAAFVLFAVGYALANVAAFAVVVALRGRTLRESYEGLGRAQPALAAALTVALFSLTGIPPLVGFAAKLALFGAAIDAGYAWLAALAVANTVLSLFYYLRVIAPMVLASPRGPVALLGREARAVAVVAALLVLLTGVGAQRLIDGLSTLALVPE